jgi:hypothetical protein
VVALGLPPLSYLNKALLIEWFGWEGVHLVPCGPAWPALSGSAAVVVALPIPERTWPEFAAWLGPRKAVVDVRAAAAMLQAAGIAVKVEREVGDRSGSVTVMRCRMAAAVYPLAPAVRMTSNSPLTTGFPARAEVHQYGWEAGEKPVLHGLAPDAGLDRLIHELGGRVVGVSTVRNLGALIEVPTPAGGTVTIMDLATVDRRPEPSGSEAPAVQLFLNGLGCGTAVFGAFCRAIPDYTAFVETVASLVARYPSLARLEKVGVSAGGRPLWRLRIGAATGRPAVLFTSGVHPFEWGPPYGLLRYAGFLLEQVAADTSYARHMLGRRQFQWVLSVAADGWESRDQPPSGLNHNRNFPGGWESCRAGERAWDAYNKRYAPDDPNPDVTRGPAPGSEPEVRALMALLDRPGEPIAALGDFHETTAPESFLHPHEEMDGTVREWPYYRDLAESVAEVFNGRFVSHANVLAFNPGLSDFPSYRLRFRESLKTPMATSQSAWIQYALTRLPHALVVEASGADATHYQTLRRTEYAALAAEQILAAEGGRIVRNPFGEPRQVTVRSARLPRRVDVMTYDANGALVVRRAQPGTQPWLLEIPSGGWAWVEYQGD